MTQPTRSISITLPNHFDRLEKFIPTSLCSPSQSSLSLSQQATRENSQEIQEITLNENDDSHNTSNDSLESCCSIEGNANSDFFEKSHEEVRRGYISKLVNMKLIPVKPKRKCQNIFVFDWDDTLFCTSHLGNCCLTTIPSQCKAVMQSLDATVSSLLLKAVRNGEVFIITNSERGWVESSARDALPRTYQVLINENIKVISARNEYEDVFPNDLYRWKLEAFLSLQQQFDKDVMTNLVVLGDSELEIRAGNVLNQQFKQSIVKTIKLKEHPRIEDLIKEHKIIFNLFDEIFMSCKSMSVELGKNSRC